MENDGIIEVDPIEEGEIRSLLFSNFPCRIEHVSGSFFDLTSHGSLVERKFEVTRNTEICSNPITGKTYNPVTGETFCGKIQLPSVPATEISMNSSLSSENISENGDNEENNKILLNKIPEILTKPIMRKKDGKIIGLKSGVRSTLLPIEGSYYRIKGTGNNYDGFTIRHEKSFQFKDQPFYDIRGCMFEQTSMREIYMTNVISKVLAVEGISVGNVPLGVHKFKLFPNEDIPKFAAVFETFGDKRLGDHLLVGLENIIPLVIQFNDHSSLMKIFDLQKRVYENPLIEEENEPDQEHTVFNLKERIKSRTITPDQFQKAYQNIISMEIKDTANLSQIRVDSEVNGYPSPQFGGFVNLMELPKNSLSFSNNLCSSDIPNFVGQEYRDLWIHFMKIVCDSSGNNDLGRILPCLYYRLGYETGRILRKMHDADINWGTFSDRLGFHENSHSNNLILNSNSILFRKLDCGTNDEKGFLLSPVDFDMAFTRDSFVYPVNNNNLEDRHDKFNKYLHTEEVGMRHHLSLFEVNVRNDPRKRRKFNWYQKKYEMIETERGKLCVWKRLLSVGLRDTLMLGYLHGLEKLEFWGIQNAGGVRGMENEIFSFSESLDLVRSIISLALISTAKNIS